MEKSRENRARRGEQLVATWEAAKQTRDPIAVSRAVAALLRFDSEEEGDET